MELYHGTNQIIREIDLNRGRLRTDFGKGFYLGSNLEVAREWAKSRAAFSGTPIIMRHNFGIVSGAIANDKVNFVVDDYIKGLVTAEEAVKMIRAIPNVIQISIHTPAALTFLAQYDASYQKMLDTGNWSEWYKLSNNSI